MLPAKASKVLGYLDHVTQQEIAGWHCSGNHETFVDIYKNNEFIETIPCDLFRKDLKDFGIIENGLAGFKLILNSKPFDKISVVCHESGEELNRSPRYIIPDEFVEIRDFERSLLAIEKFTNRSLTDAYNHFLTRDLLVKPVLNSFGHVVGITYLSKSRSRKWVELFKSEQSIINAQFAFQNFLRKRNIPHSKVINIDCKNPNSIFFEYVDGSSLSSMAFDFLDGKHVSSKINDILEILVRIDSVEIVDLKSNFRSIFDINVALRNFTFFRKYFPKVVKLIGRLLANLKLAKVFFLLRLFLHLSFSTKRFSHGDLHPSNIIQTKEGQFVLLDWDEYGFYPLGFDLACFLRPYNIESNMAECSQILASYAMKLNLKSSQSSELKFNFWAIIYFLFALDDPAFTNCNLAGVLQTKLSKQQF